MPPRLPSQSLQACCAELSSFSSSSSGSSIAIASVSPLERALLSSQFLSLPSSCRSFSSSTNRQRRNSPILKQRMQDWFKKRGHEFKTHRPGQPSYLSSKADDLRPFPSNPAFISQPVLSEDARELIWNKVMVKWEGVKAVSAELGVDQRRVAAIVRMKEVEKDWKAKVCRSTLVFYNDLPAPPGLASVSVMIHKKIRLVLKTAHKTHGYKKALRASLIGTQHLLFLITSE